MTEAEKIAATVAGPAAATVLLAHAVTAGTGAGHVAALLGIAAAQWLAIRAAERRGHPKAPSARGNRAEPLPAKIAKGRATERAAVEREPIEATAAALPRGVPALLAALAEAGRPMSVSELAEAMKVSTGEASKRVARAGALVTRRREGRKVLVAAAESSR
jgi:hypothetical protein